jgi:hypothetical protein
LDQKKNRNASLNENENEINGVMENDGEKEFNYEEILLLITETEPSRTEKSAGFFIHFIQQFM